MELLEKRKRKGKPWKKKKDSRIIVAQCALVAQLDRAPGYEPGGQRFESSPVQLHIL